MGRLIGNVQPIIAPIVVHPKILTIGVKNGTFCCLIVVNPVKNPIEVDTVITGGRNS